MAEYFTPKNAPSLSIEFRVIKGQPQTLTQPGYTDEVEFLDIYENESPVSQVFYEALIEQHKDRWESEILASQKVEA